MSATFDPTLANARDILRFDVGDTAVATAIWPDALYDAQIARYPDDLREAELAIVEGLLVLFAQKPDAFKAAGQIEVTWKERIAAWQALRDRLRAELGLIPSTNLRESRAATVRVRYTF